MSDPSKVSGAISVLVPEWQLIRDVRAGASRIREAGELYLPKFQSELDDEFGYKRRLSVAPWSAHYEDATRSLVGKPFSKEVKLQGDVNPRVAEWAENIDNAGTNLHNFSREAFEDAVHLGMHHILIDYVSTEGAKSIGDERRAGARPYLRHVPADSVVQYHTETRNGARYLRRFRFRDDTVEIDEASGEELTQERIRQIDDVDGTITAKVWTKTDKGWDEGEERPLTIDQIPVVTIWFGPRFQDGQMSKPPMLDLAYRQIDHYQASSGLKNILENAGFPMLQAKGMRPAVDKDKKPVAVVVGPNAVLYAPPAQTGERPEWGYISPEPGLIKELRENLKDIEQEMRQLGLQPTMPSIGLQNMAATTTAVNAARTHSAVQAWAFHLKDGLEQALALMCRYEKLDEETEVYVHTDFSPEVLSGNDEKLLLDALSLGHISRETFWDEMMRRDLLGPSFDKDAEENRLADDDGGLGMTDQDEEDEGGEDR